MEHGSPYLRSPGSFPSFLFLVLRALALTKLTIVAELIPTGASRVYRA